MLTSPPLPEREADKVCDYASRMSHPLPSRKGQLYKTFTTTRSRTYRTLIKRALTLSMKDGVQVHVSRGDNNRSR